MNPTVSRIRNSASNINAAYSCLNNHAIETPNALARVTTSISDTDVVHSQAWICQVGICLLTMTGLESMESFNHPESWEAIRKAILGSDVSSIADVSDQNGLFDFREDKAKSIVRELLEKEYNEKVAVEKDGTSTFILDEEKFMGEVVTLHDRPIHCAFLRKAS